MKCIVYSVLLFTGLSLLVACSNGTYTANPSSNANSSVNPLHPLTSSQFNWKGTDPMSANINGTNFVASSYSYVFDSGTSVLTGYNGNQALVISLTNTYKGNLYTMQFHQYSTSAYWTDSLGNANNYYFSDLGNSGELWMLESDSAFLKGEFYFQGISSTGAIINVTNGYFNIPKS